LLVRRFVAEVRLVALVGTALVGLAPVGPLAHAVFSIATRSAAMPREPYALTEAQVAETLGISLGSVKAYGSRGIAALRLAMEAPA